MMIQEETEAAGPHDAAHRRPIGADESPTEAVLRAVAAASGRDVTGETGDDKTGTLEPLYDTLNPDALDTLLEPGPRRDGSPVCVEFVYCGYRVAVDSNRGVRVEPQ